MLFLSDQTVLGMEWNGMEWDSYTCSSKPSDIPSTGKISATWAAGSLVLSKGRQARIDCHRLKANAHDRLLAPLAFCQPRSPNNACPNLLLTSEGAEGRQRHKKASVEMWVVGSCAEIEDRMPWRIQTKERHLITCCASSQGPWRLTTRSSQ